MGAQILALLEHPEDVTQVKGCLEVAGYEICVVSSFAKAKAMLQEHSFALIISDVHLENGGSVFDFLRWVRSDRRFRVTPFVLFSLQPNETAKYLADGVRTAARAMGATKYICMEKFDPVVLSQEISEVLVDGVPVPNTYDTR